MFGDRFGRLHHLCPSVLDALSNVEVPHSGMTTGRPGHEQNDMLQYGS
jgi:hypothetical protein